jgi:hypothetical protein
MASSLGNRRRASRDRDEFHVLVHVDLLVRVVLVGNPMVTFDLHEVVSGGIDAGIGKDLARR